jgi:hypothetical protein
MTSFARFLDAVTCATATVVPRRFRNVLFVFWIEGFSPDEAVAGIRVLRGAE